MKTTTVLKSTLFLGLAASFASAQPVARTSHWVLLPPKTSMTKSPASVANLRAALTAGTNRKPEEHADLQSRAALQQALPGTWLVHVTVQAANGVDAPPPFLGIIQFSADGNVIQTETDAMAPPTSIVGQGVWVAAPSRGFDFTFYSLLFDGQDFFGVSKVQAHAQLSQNNSSIQGTFKVAFYDPDGNLLVSGSGIFEGTPLEL